jgi:TatD DNase family protein
MLSTRSSIKQFMIIDTHSHISFKAYDKDREEVIKRTREEGVVCIDVGTKYETSKSAVELAGKNEGIYAAIGMHPIHIKTDLLKLKMDEEEGAFAPLGEEYDVARYRDLVLRSRSDEGKNKIVAIGEIGLDYYYKPKTTSRLEQFKELQKKVFIEQLNLAKELNLPVIIHCRMAHEDILEILKSQNPNPNDQKLCGVIHCFTGNWEQAQKYMDLGFYLGINGIIFKFDIDKVIKKTPLDKILVETDCPYLTPPMATEKRNEPIFVKHVIQKIADLRGVSFDEVASAATANAKKLFGI